jgi:hypothetical protein
MSRLSTTAIATILTVGLTVLGGRAISADKYTVQVPGGLAFSEFRGYERLASHLDQRQQRQVCRDFGESSYDGRSSGGRARQRQAFPGWGQDGENSLEPQNTRSVSWPAEGSRYPS